MGSSKHVVNLRRLKVTLNVLSGINQEIGAKIDQFGRPKCSRPRRLMALAELEEDSKSLANAISLVEKKMQQEGC